MAHSPNGDAEVVAFRIAHPGVAVEALNDGCAESDEPVDLITVTPDRCGDVEMQPTFPCGSCVVDSLEAQFEFGAVDDHRRIGFGREPERSQPSDLGIVIRPNFEAVERRCPESGQQRRELAIDHDLRQPSHRHIVAHVSNGGEPSGCRGNARYHPAQWTLAA